MLIMQKVVNMVFFEDILFDFVAKLILWSQRNLQETINKEAIYKTAIPMKMHLKS